MKTPTTGFSIGRQEQVSINREFLLSQGWVLDKEYPLFENFTHPKSGFLIATITLYGGFAISELDWANRVPETTFSTMNPDLTKMDYFTILKLLKINI